MKQYASPYAASHFSQRAKNYTQRKNVYPHVPLAVNKAKNQAHNYDCSPNWDDFTQFSVQITPKNHLFRNWSDDN
jgi:hypothetical protein